MKSQGIKMLKADKAQGQAGSGVCKMAEANDCFTVGSIVSCQTCHSQDIEGEVLAFDPQTKMLILKCPASNGRTSLNDVFIVNLSMVSSIAVKKENTATSSTPPFLNIDKITQRLRNKIEEEKRVVASMNSGASPEGQRLYMAISKTISDVCWNGDNIIVWNTVRITPPYKAENLVGDADCKAVSHIRKIMDKHIKEAIGEIEN